MQYYLPNDIYLYIGNFHESKKYIARFLICCKATYEYGRGLLAKFRKWKSTNIYDCDKDALRFNIEIADKKEDDLADRALSLLDQSFMDYIFKFYRYNNFKDHLEDKTKSTRFDSFPLPFNFESYVILKNLIFKKI